MRSIRGLGLAACALFALAVGGGVAFAQYSASNYMAPGGADWEIGGGLTVQSGGTATVASGGTLTAASGSTVNLNGTTAFGGTLTASASCLIERDINLNSGTVDQRIFHIAGRAEVIQSITARVVTAAGGALTGKVQKVPSGTATSAGTDVQTATFNLNSASNTNVAGTVTAGTLAAGDALIVKLSTTIGSTIGDIEVCLGPA